MLSRIFMMKHLSYSPLCMLLSLSKGYIIGNIIVCLIIANHQTLKIHKKYFFLYIKLFIIQIYCE